MTKQQEEMIINHVTRPRGFDQRITLAGGCGLTEDTTRDGGGIAVAAAEECPLVRFGASAHLWYSIYYVSFNFGISQGSTSKDLLINDTVPEEHNRLIPFNLHEGKGTSPFSVHNERVQENYCLMGVEEGRRG